MVLYTLDGLADNVAFAGLLEAELEKVAAFTVGNNSDCSLVGQLSEAEPDAEKLSEHTDGDSVAGH